MHVEYALGLQARIIKPIPGAKVSSMNFYFDYSSPYGYVASERIEEIATRHGRQVHWCPMLLGAIFKVTGAAPLTEYPVKGAYALHDFNRSAREYKLDYVQPETFPIATVAAARATLWAKERTDPDSAEKTAALVHALYRGFYVDTRPINEARTVVAIAGEVGFDTSQVEQAIGDTTIKTRLRQDIEAAIELGVFGSPTIEIDGELFWGSDRLEQIDRWLTVGGW